MKMHHSLAADYIPYPDNGTRIPDSLCLGRGHQRPQLVGVARVRFPYAPHLLGDVTQPRPDEPGLPRRLSVCDRISAWHGPDSQQMCSLKLHSGKNVGHRGAPKGTSLYRTAAPGCSRHRTMRSPSDLKACAYYAAAGNTVSAQHAA